jgi:hypothetical protein
MRTLRILIILFFFSSPVWAECDISKFDIDYMQEVHDKYKNDPNVKNAEEFFNSIPSRFCEFNKVYGGTEDGDEFKPGPLYELDMHETLPKLESFISDKKLISKYVSLASEAEWYADNVNALKYAYYELFLKKPNLVIKNIMSLPKTKRKTATTFLFDGPHPTILNDDKKKELCNIDEQFCLILNPVQEEMLQKEHNH